MNNYRIHDYLDSINRNSGKCKSCGKVIAWSRERLAAHKRSSCPNPTEEEKQLFAKAVVEDPEDTGKTVLNFDISLYLTNFDKEGKKNGTCRSCSATVAWSRPRVAAHKRGNCPTATMEEKVFFAKENMIARPKTDPDDPTTRFNFDISQYLHTFDKAHGGRGTCISCNAIVPWARDRVAAHKRGKCTGTTAEEKIFFMKPSADAPTYTVSHLPRESLSKWNRAKRTTIDAALGQLYFQTEFPVELANTSEWKRLITLLNPEYAEVMPTANSLEKRFKEDGCFICNKRLNVARKSLRSFLGSDESDNHSRVYEIFESWTGNELTPEIRNNSAVCSSCFDYLNRYKEFEFQCQEIQTTLTSKYLQKQSPDEPSSSNQQVYIKQEPPLDDADFGELEATTEVEAWTFNEMPEYEEEEALEEVKPLIQIFECDQCGVEFSKKRDLYDHLATHVEPKERFPCPECHNRNYTTTVGLEVHLATDHDRAQQGPFTCLHCSKSIETRTSLREHLYSHKRSQERIICSICGVSLNPRSMELHMRMHNDIRPFECEFTGCEKRFRTAVKRKIHHRVHTGEKIFSCPHCPEKRFAQDMGRDLHMKKYHGYSGTRGRNTAEEATCQICGITVPTQAKLRAHLVKIHEVVDDDAEMD